MHPVITDLHPKPGLTAVVDREPSGVGLSLLRLSSGERWSETTPAETALLLMGGRVTMSSTPMAVSAERDSLFDELGGVLLVSTGSRVAVEAHSEVELAVVRVEGQGEFDPVWFGETEARVDRRGEGGLNDAAFRFVRTYLDRANTPPESSMVLGEVINLPGRWSSYPPHHHRQPEVYHYRFSPSHGYGHAEHGDDVYKVTNLDSLVIEPGRSHAQCAAPGYAMYYLWAIRHLDGDPYLKPTFEERHAGLLDRDAPYWTPDDTA